MQTLKILTLGALAMFSRYDAGGGCVANFSPSASDMGADMGATLQVTPTRISVTAGAVLQLDGGPGRAGQSVKLKQGALEVTLGVLDGQGHLQRTLSTAELTTLALGPAQVTDGAGGQAVVRFFIEPRLDNAPALYRVGRTIKSDPTTVWVGVTGKKILTLEFRDASGIPGMPIISQAIGEYLLDNSGNIIPAALNYKNYNSFVFEGNFLDTGTNYLYSSTGIGLTARSINIAEYFSANKSTLMRKCPLDAGCEMTLVPRPYSRITSLTSERSGTLFAAIITASGAPAGLKVFRDGTLGAAVDLMGASTALPHETMLGAGKLNDDDQPDLIALTPAGAVTIWVGGPGPLVASDSLTAAVQQGLSALGIAAPSALGVGDLDGDGLDDLVVASNAQVVTLLNQGDGHFSGSAGPTAPAGLAPVTALAIGDVSVSGRGIPDLVLASKDQHSIGAIESSATY
jgi:hypothetical protein